MVDLGYFQLSFGFPREWHSAACMPLAPPSSFLMWLWCADHAAGGAAVLGHGRRRTRTGHAGHGQPGLLPAQGPACAVHAPPGPWQVPGPVHDPEHRRLPHCLLLPQQRPPGAVKWAIVCLFWEWDWDNMTLPTGGPPSSVNQGMQQCQCLCTNLSTANSPTASYHHSSATQVQWKHSILS